MSIQYMVWLTSVVDTRAVPSFISSELVPLAFGDHVRCKQSLDIAEADNNLLKAFKYNPLVMRLGICTAHLGFVLCDKLTA